MMLLERVFSGQGVDYLGLFVERSEKGYKRYSLWGSFWNVLERGSGSSGNVPKRVSFHQNVLKRVW